MEIAFKSIAIGMFLFAVFLSGCVVGRNDLIGCRKTVLIDIAEHEKFDADFQKAAHPDFLSTLTKGK